MTYLAATEGPTEGASAFARSCSWLAALWAGKAGIFSSGIMCFYGVLRSDRRLLATGSIAHLFF